MKLLYIANLRLPTEKAYGIQVTKMCEAFTSQGVDVTLIYPFRKNHIKDDLFSYYSIKKNFKTKKILTLDFYFPGRLDKIAVNIKSIISALSLSFYAITQKTDIIYSRDEWPLYFLSFFRKNLIYEAHRFSVGRDFFYRRFKNKNLKIIVITNRLKGDFINLGFKHENILVAPDGVDLAEFDIDISKEEARTRVGLPLDKKIVMYTGHLFEWKGADSLLEAARISNDKFPMTNILFVFVGGMDYDVKKFKDRAGELENVLILGHKLHKEIPYYLKAADILVLPNSNKEEISKSYTSPLKLFEYMASGRSIVASDLPSISEVLNGRNSVLVKSDDAESLVAGIKKVFDDKTLGEELAKKAGEDVQNYSWKKRADNIIKFI